jgi:ferredoxin
MAKCDYCGKKLCPTCHQHVTAERKTADMRDALAFAYKLLEDANVEVARRARAQIERALEHGFPGGS